MHCSMNWHQQCYITNPTARKHNMTGTPEDPSAPFQSVIPSSNNHFSYFLASEISCACFWTWHKWNYTKYFLLFALLSLNVMFVGSSALLHVLGVHLFSLLDSIRLYEYTTNISLPGEWTFGPLWIIHYEISCTKLAVDRDTHFCWLLVD